MLIFCSGSVAIMIAFLVEIKPVFIEPWIKLLGPATVSSIAIESQVDERYLLETGAVL